MKIKKFDSINVVPFIDIILVLLVIVLTTASFVVKGLIPIDLSQSDSKIRYKHKKDDLIITIKNSGDIFLNKIQVSRNLLENEILKYKKNTNISINCDKNSKFDNFMQILDLLKQNSYANIGIITKNE
jgi:biopolymer transport protein ExbD